MSCKCRNYLFKFITFDKKKKQRVRFIPFNKEKKMDREKRNTKKNVIWYGWRCTPLPPEEKCQKYQTIVTTRVLSIPNKSVDFRDQDRNQYTIYFVVDII